MSFSVGGRSVRLNPHWLVCSCRMCLPPRHHETKTGALPVNPALDGLVPGRCDGGAGVHGTAHAGDGGVPSVVDLWEAVELHLDDLATGVVDVRADDEALGVALDAVADGDDVSGLFTKIMGWGER